MNRFLPVLVLCACGVESDEEDPPRGTEIGDEGGPFCSEEMSPLDPAQVPEGFDESPEAYFEPLTGAFDDGEGVATLTADLSAGQFVDEEPPMWEGGPDETEPPPPVCNDRVWVPIALQVEVPGLGLDTGNADITWSTEATRLSAQVQTRFEVRTDPDDDEGGTDEGGTPVDTGTVTWEPGWAPTTFDPERMMEVLFVVSGTPAGGGWELTFAWWGTSHPEGPDGYVSFYEEDVQTRVFRPAP